MAFIVKIGLTPKMRRVGLRIDQVRNHTPSVPDQPDQPCSLVKLDMDAYKWQVLMEPEGFRKLYGGVVQGSIARGLGEGADVTLLHPTQPDVRLLTLLSMTFTARAKVKGKVVANFDQGSGTPEIYTYFWRELEYPEMTYMERMQEVIQICCHNYLDGTAREEFGNLASGGNLAIAAATMLFFLAPVGLAINAIRAVVGYALLGSSLHVDYEYYKARIIDIQYACNKSNVSKNDMNTAGKALAEILTKIMGDIAMMKLGHVMAKGANWIMERGRLSRLFTSKSKQEWESEGRKEEAQPRSAKLAGTVVNKNWINEIKPSELEGIGMLEGELKAFRALANRGYYVVCRSCNSARLRWLRKGIAINGKPLWIKTKSLKGLKNAFYEGLTGMRKDGRDTVYSLDHLEPVKNLPSNFKVEFMQKGQSSQGKVYKLKAGKQMNEITGHENEIYFVDVGEAYVITDNHGRAYIPDLDVVLFQKKLANGGYGPPGMNTALGKQPENYSGGDHALIEADFNSFFKRYCHYPDGYEPVQHGGGAGTAGYLKSAKDPSALSLSSRKPGWAPIRPSEGECVVAVQGLPGEVGIARTWHDVTAFHQANPFGEWRW